ncbi:MAG: hypothetical protein WAM17_00115 [Rhodoplanes sp.]
MSDSAGIAALLTAMQQTLCIATALSQQAKNVAHTPFFALVHAA